MREWSRGIVALPSEYWINRDLRGSIRCVHWVLDVCMFADDYWPEYNICILWFVLGYDVCQSTVQVADKRYKVLSTNPQIGEKKKSNHYTSKCLIVSILECKVMFKWCLMILLPIVVKTMNEVEWERTMEQTQLCTHIALWFSGILITVPSIYGCVPGGVQGERTRGA